MFAKRSFCRAGHAPATCAITWCGNNQWLKHLLLLLLHLPRMQTDYYKNPDKCGRCGNNCTAKLQVQSAPCVRGTCSVTSCRAGHSDCDGDGDNACETPADSCICTAPLVNLTATLTCQETCDAENGKLLEIEAVYTCVPRCPEGLVDCDLGGVCKVCKRQQQCMRSMLGPCCVPCQTPVQCTHDVHTTGHSW
jgi:hypothetical protein